MNTNTPDTNRTSQIQQRSDAGPPRMHTHDPETLESAPPPNNNKSLIIAGVSVGVSLFVMGLGLLLRGGSGPAQAAPVAPPIATGFLEEQRQMMREGMQMAREAQQAQREHMERVRKAMEESGEAAPGTFHGD